MTAKITGFLATCHSQLVMVRKDKRHTLYVHKTERRGIGHPRIARESGRQHLPAGTVQADRVAKVSMRANSAVRAGEISGPAAPVSA